jgi:hypothetical protein
LLSDLRERERLRRERRLRLAQLPQRRVSVVG